jgi:hypothetical protein
MIGYPGHRRIQGRPVGQGVEARAAHAESRVEQAGALQVKTADGDTVSISFASLRALSLDAFQARGGRSAAEGGGGAQSSAVSVSVRVQGTLDDQEAADIQDLLGRMMGAVEDARDGTLDAPPADLLAAGSLETLASYTFGYRENALARYGYAER